MSKRAKHHSRRDEEEVLAKVPRMAATVIEKSKHPEVKAPAEKAVEEEDSLYSNDAAARARARRKILEEEYALPELPTFSGNDAEGLANAAANIAMGPKRKRAQYITQALFNPISLTGIALGAKGLYDWYWRTQTSFADKVNYQVQAKILPDLMDSWTKKLAEKISF